jgi:hypothetical protein
MKNFLILILSLFTISAFGQQITKEKQDSVDIIHTKIPGTEELVLSPDSSFLERLVYNGKVTMNLESGHGHIDSANINGTKVKIFKWCNGSGVTPIYISDTIYSSDTNKIKPTKVLYLKK